MNRLSLLTGTAVIACVGALSTSACAQDVRSFDIPAGSMRDALNAYATQADRQILFAGEAVAGLETSGLRGRYRPGEALDRLLAGSGLVWAETRPGVISVRRVLQATVDDATVELDEVVVTGTLLRSAGTQASPVVTLDRDDLDRRGYGTVAEALVNLPQNYAGQGTPASVLSFADPAGSNSTVATGVNLRGLGPDATLTLVNGRRLAGTGSRGEFSDVSALPSGAVERVDVLLDGASALYGSDAVAGVVNVIMRRSFDGHETRLRAGTAQGGAETLSLSHLAGRAWETGSALVSWEYQTTGALNAGDRAFTADGDLRPFGGSDRRLIFSSPGNILAFDPAQGGYVSAWAIRPGPNGVARTPADFVAGAANLRSQVEGVDLIPDTDRHSLYGRVRQSLGERLELSADVRFSRREYGFDNAAPVALFQVTAANPFLVPLAGETTQLIGYSFIDDLGASRQDGTSRSLGVTAGAELALGGWTLDGYLAWAEDRGESRTSGLTNAAFLNEALGNTPDDPSTAFSAVRDGFFNPYGAGAANGAAVLAFVGSGYSASSDRNVAQSANLLLQGEPLSLAGGDVAVALGLQVRRETFGTTATSFTGSASPLVFDTPGRGRTISAVFAEARIPLIGPENGRPGVRGLELSLAGRIEDYEDFGQTANPKIGLVWRPVEGLDLKASWGTSFRAPALPQLYDATEAAPTFLERPDGSSVLALYRYGGNRDLDPETAETLTAGFDWQSSSGWRVALSYFDTRFVDRISQPVNENLAGALTDPALAAFVTLIDPVNSAADLALIRSFVDDPAYGYGSLFPAESYGAILDARWVNASEVRVSGLDLNIGRSLAFGDQSLELEAAASYLIAYDTRLTAAAPSSAVLDRVGYPVRLRSRAGAVWSRGEVAAGLHWNRVSAYEDAVGRDIGAWNTADLQLTWSPLRGALTGLRVIASVQNLFDADPPVYDAPTGLGYDPGQADLLGRVVSLQLVKRW